VRDCAVFGIPEEEYGEQLCACIEPEPGSALDADAVTAFLKARLANFKVPKTVSFVEALPREDSGKIFKRRLREPYWQGRQQKI
jgi:long-chain acyl-CoA synthetase